jgi:hypothetical protein
MTLIEFIEFGKKINSVPIPISTSQSVQLDSVNHRTDLWSDAVEGLTKVRWL